MTTSSLKFCGDKNETFQAVLHWTKQELNGKGSLALVSVFATGVLPWSLGPAETAVTSRRL